MVQTPTCSEFQMAGTGACVVDWMCLFQHASHVVVDLMGLLQLSLGVDISTPHLGSAPLGSGQKALFSEASARWYCSTVGSPCSVMPTVSFALLFAVSVIDP